MSLQVAIWNIDENVAPTARSTDSNSSGEGKKPPGYHRSGTPELAR